MNECGWGNGMGGMMGGVDDDWDAWMHDVWEAMRDHHHDAMGHCLDAVQCHQTETDWHDAMSGSFDHMRDMDHDWPEDCHW